MIGENILRLIKQMEKAPGTLKRREILAKNDSVTLRTILKLTYDPYQRYHIRVVPDEIQGIGTADFSMDTIKILHDLTARKITGIDARRRLFTHLQKLTPAAGEVLRRIVKKDLRCGIRANTINKVFPDLIPDHRVMKPKDYDANHVPESFAVCPKLDGIRGTYRNGYIISNGGKVIPNLDHITTKLNPSQQYDGELMVEGVDFDKASGYIRSHRKDKTRVSYHIFDCITVPELPFKQRYDMIPVGWRTPHVKLFYPSDPFGLIDIYYTNARAQGYEGLVIKDLESPYERKRSWAWMKLKPREDAEFTIIGLYEGEGKYVGMMGGLIVQTGPNQTCKVGGGFTDYQREVWWHRPTKVVGRKATIYFMERNKTTGSLRHPEFKSIRWDQ